MDNEIKNIISTLNDFREFSDTDDRSGWRKSLRRMSWILLLLSAVLFVALLGFWVWSTLDSPLSPCSKRVAQAVAILCQLTAIIALIVDIVPGVLLVFTFHADAFKRLQAETHHDFKLARQLTIFGQNTLKATRDWLDIVIARRRSRIAFFMGGADKVALASLAAMGWSALNELSGDRHTWQYSIFMLGAALICGFAFGAVFLTLVIRRYEYQRDLLALALSLIKTDPAKDIDRNA